MSKILNTASFVIYRALKAKPQTAMELTRYLSKLDDGLYRQIISRVLTEGNGHLWEKIEGTGKKNLPAKYQVKSIPEEIEQPEADMNINLVRLFCNRDEVDSIMDDLMRRRDALISKGCSFAHESEMEKQARIIIKEDLLSNVGKLALVSQTLLMRKKGTYLAALHLNKGA